MKLLSRIIACYALIACMAWDAALGQITANADSKEVVKGTDTLFVFDSTVVPELTAKFSDGSPSTYEWSQFDSISTKDFTIPLSATSATISGLTWGGYRVKVTNTATSVAETYKAWVFIDKFTVKLDQDNKGYVKLVDSDCGHVTLRAINTPGGLFRYYNFVTSQFDTIANKYKYEWVQDGNVLKVKNPLDPKYVTYDPPAKSTPVTYKVTTTDRFGRVQEASVLLESVVPIAKFDYKIDSVVDGKYPAPCRVKFTNQSENAKKYVLYTGDHYTPGQDTLYTADTTHIYYIPKTYHVILEAEGPLDDCKRSDSVDITVEEASIKMPNVFTPGTDGKNDYFKPDNMSIRHFRFTVYSRWGRKIYYYESDNMGGGKDEYGNPGWNGWNGKINGTGEYAADGAYYYVLEVLPWPTDPTYAAAQKANASSTTTSTTTSSTTQNAVTNGKYSGFFYLFGPH